MIGHIQELVIDCAEPIRLARFWATVLGGDPVEREPAWAYVDPPDGQPRLAFQRVPEAKRAKNRLHLDIEADDIVVARDRLEEEGAEAVGEIVTDEQGGFQVMRDPEGNEFCLVG
jgi:predicted enzyme related to lactoylglutathione lyase